METSNEHLSKMNEQEAFLEDHNCCCLCGTELQFKHTVDYLTLQVNEEASCPSCRIQLKKRDYTLQ